MDLHSLIDRFSDQENESCSNTYGAHALKQIRDNAGEECPICLADPMQDQTVTGCLHSACKDCWVNLIEVSTGNSPF
jgi:DNA repair protein RAD5